MCLYGYYAEHARAAAVVAVSVVAAAVSVSVASSLLVTFYAKPTNTITGFPSVQRSDAYNAAALLNAQTGFCCIILL